MGIIEYFRSLRDRYTARKKFRKDNTERFYARCREGIFSFFRPHLTGNGFYLELSNKEGLIEYLAQHQPGRTIESTLLGQRPKNQYITKDLQTKVNDGTKPVYEAFSRLVNYFKGFSKQRLLKYNSVSLAYNPLEEGCQTTSSGTNLSFNFG